MVKRLPTVRSILDAGSLGRRVARDYDLGPFQECRFFTFGLNDTYALWTGAGHYMLRVYRHDWRTSEDIAHEVDALVHLETRGVPVASSIRRVDGGFVGEVPTAEGPRACVLFNHAPGRERFGALDESRRYGAAVATIHAATDDFRSEHRRFALDVEYLLERPFEAVGPFLAGRRDDRVYLQQLVEQLRTRLGGLTDDALDRGFCHGDLHGGNAHTADDGTITFFDFDCCGSGPRAYDVAAFRWRHEWRRRDASANWAAFLDGYRSVRRLSAAAEAATDLFVPIREVWLLGVHAQTATDRGHSWNMLNQEYLDSRFGFLRTWWDEHLS